LLLELHQGKLTGVDGPLTYKLHSYLYQSKVEVKLDLLDLATFLPPLWTYFIGGKWPDNISYVMYDSVSPRLRLCLSASVVMQTVQQPLCSRAAQQMRGGKKPLCLGHGFLLLTPV